MNNIIIVLLVIGILGLVWSRLRNNPKVKEFIKKHINISDCHNLHQPPDCFDCNDGNDQCQLYPDCRHMREHIFKIGEIREEV